MNKDTTTHLIEAPEPYQAIAPGPDQAILVHQDYRIDTELFSTKKRKGSLGSHAFTNLTSWLEYIDSHDELRREVRMAKNEITCTFSDPAENQYLALSMGTAALKIEKSSAWQLLSSIQHRSFKNYQTILDLVSRLEYSGSLQTGDQSPKVEDFEAIKTETTTKTAEDFNEFTGTKTARIHAPQKILWKLDYFDPSFCTNTELGSSITGSIALRWKYKDKESKDGLMAQILTPNWEIIELAQTNALLSLISSRLNLTIHH